MDKSQENVLNKMRSEIKRRNYSYKTEKSYMGWVQRLIGYHGSSPIDITSGDIVEYLNYLSEERGVSASTQNQALCAIVFLFKQVMGKDIAGLDGLKRAKESSTLPTVLSKREVRTILGHMKGRMKKLVTYLLYGAGLRISEALRLRVKDIDFDNGQIYVRNSKGAKDRTTLFPTVVERALQKQVQLVTSRHEADKQMGYGRAPMPNALSVKYPNADKKINWQYLFPSQQLTRDQKTGRRCRYHMSPSTVQKAISRGVERSGICKSVSAHTFRHSFATHLLQDGCDIRTVQQLLGHKHLKTTMKYTHVTRPASDIQSPADVLAV